MFDAQFLIVQTLNGLQLSMLLFLLSTGLSVVFGLMNFINLAHGTLYMVGAYLGLSAVRAFDSYWSAFVLAPIGVALIGAVLYLVLLRRLQQASPMKQVLVTFGLIFIGFDLVRMIWGRLPQTIPMPDVFAGSTQVFGETYPVYRLFIIGLGLLVMLALYLGLERTRLGAIVRAGGRQPYYGRGARDQYRPRFLHRLLSWLLSRRSRRRGCRAGVFHLSGYGHVYSDSDPHRGRCRWSRQSQRRRRRLAVDRYGRYLRAGHGAGVCQRDHLCAHGRHIGIPAPGSDPGPCGALMPGRDPVRWPLFVVLAALSAAGFVFSDLFGKELIAEIAIFAIFAMSLDLLVGVVGLVSLGHAAFFGIGAYTTAACTVFWGWPVSFATLAAVLVSGLAALVAGSFAVHLSGVFFIMITLAIGQMAYAYFFKSRAFGG